ncbi:3-hydroxybutyrate oligomer hydrolase family protein [Ramlibacter sp.]|uniref:3-hydroxybutyrate oligomer hydrolase family protein n=1 Tax=Ramlibacter sp. TaxID=1917967 RepID=UPI002CBD743B|nr:3-hydroxybutyrate oligomer hydrolase family protein [Ramlibacter sp.]HWI82148.1 3-hydroxybutyrate oligomer hydrolase family protein [Ramlibacter sp.]
MRRLWKSKVTVAAGAAVLLATGCGGGGGSPALNELPPGIGSVAGPASYDGATNDLLTAGLGKSGLAGAAPGFADPANPTAAELRRRAIYTNYRAVLDITAAGGYGTLYGPNVAVDGTVTASEGKIAGKEYLAYADDGSGRKNVTLMVQIPDSFDRNSPCIITAPSSGSRGVYGAIGSAGEWGLKRGCAVAYTDAGKGTGYHDLAADQVNLMDGRLVARSAAGSLASFASDLAGAALAAFNSAFPNRIAYKHVHSQQNPEKDWGRNVLDSVRFALWALNEQHGAAYGDSGRKLRTFTADNTLVIASSISNGGAESLQAAEQDQEGLIDAVAVAEPSAQPNSMAGVSVQFAGAPVANAGKPLIDYFTYRMLYEPCAAISVNAQAPNGTRPGWFGFGTAPLGSALTQVGGQELQTIAANRCQSLADKGLVGGTTTAQQADAALAKLQAYGWTDPLGNALHASHYRLADVYVAYGYVAAYGRFSVADNVCGFSLANVDAAGNVAPQAASRNILFATSNGLNSGGDVIYNDSVGGARLYHLGVSPSTNRMDGALDGMLCLRNLVTGVDTVTGAALPAAVQAASQRVQSGMREVLLTGDLHRKPVVIVAGRSDTLVPVNHSSRAYVAFNSKVEGAASNLRYYEIENGQHFDAFLPNATGGGVQGYDTLFVPVHAYFVKAMDLMWARLKSGAALPPSQVVRTTPRGGAPGAAPAITSANVPPIAAAPAAGNAITATAGTIAIPR